LATNLVVNGVSFAYPNTGDQQWGSAASAWALAVTNGMLQKAGGTFTLTADVNFGASYGLLSAYFSTRTASPSTAGVIRLATAESIGWRNNANGGNLLLTTDASDNLTFNGHILSSSSGIVPVAAGGTGLASYTTGDMLYASGATTLSKLAIGTVNKVAVSTGSAPSWALLVNANIDAAAAIAYSKLALTGAILNADLAGSIAYSKLSLTGAILNADLAGSIAYTKLATLNTGQIVAGNAGTATATTLGGDATIGATGTLTIAALAVTAAKMSSGAASSGTVATADGSGNVSYAAQASSPDGSAIYFNGSLAASVAANALTIALKTKAGSDASGGSAVTIGMRNSTLTTGTYNARTVTAALSVVVPDATGLGLTTGVTSVLYVYAIDNAGTVELAVSPSNFWDEQKLQTTVAVASGSSLTSLYSTTARSNVPVRLIGRIEVNLAASTHWSNSPTSVSNLPVKYGRQIVLGTPQTTVGSVTNASYTAPTNAPTVTITAERTGYYKIWGQFAIDGPSSVDAYIEVIATSGSPTVIFNQDTLAPAATSTLAVGSTQPYTIVGLVAGSAYTFSVKMKSASGQVNIRNDKPATGHVLIAEEL
jgi:hypothetical protein